VDLRAVLHGVGLSGHGSSKRHEYLALREEFKGWSCVMDDLNRISGLIITASFSLVKKLGCGLSESVYETVLARDLARCGLTVERQKKISFEYEGLWFENAFRVDLLVEGAVVVEVKSLPSLRYVHKKQLLTYLRLLDCRLGLLLKFGSPLFRDGIKRIVNGL
jgi:iron complex transport system substrate-binding protein